MKIMCILHKYICFSLVTFSILQMSFLFTMSKYKADDLRTFQSYKLVPKNSDGKGNKWFLKQDTLFSH